MKYASLFVMKKSLQEGDSLKQIGFSIRYCKLKEPAKSYKFLSSGVILKSPNNITFSYVSKYMERHSDKLSKKTDFLWPGGLYIYLLLTISSNGDLFLEKEFHYCLCSSLGVSQESFINIHA